MTREKIVSIGRSSLTIVVKRVKGRLYVYDEYRLNGKVITQYIGPLEEMARVFQIYKTLGKVEKLSKRDLRILAKMIVEEIIKKLDVVNSSRKQVGVVRRPGFEPGISGVAGRRPSPG